MEAYFTVSQFQEKQKNKLKTIWWSISLASIETYFSSFIVFLHDNCVWKKRSCLPLEIQTVSILAYQTILDFWDKVN